MIPSKLKCTFAFREKCTVLHSEPSHAHVNTFRHIKKLQLPVVCFLTPQHRHSRCYIFILRTWVNAGFSNCFGLDDYKEEAWHLHHANSLCSKSSCWEASKLQVQFDLEQRTDCHSPSTFPVIKLSKNSILALLWGVIEDHEVPGI